MKRYNSHLIEVCEIKEGNASKKGFNRVKMQQIFLHNINNNRN